MGTSQPEQALPDMSNQVCSFDEFSVCLGDLMRGERATMGKSLLDVERELKIKAVYISAIENADADAFETPGFIPGYVRSYARYLGMDPDKTFAVFCSESGYVPTKGIAPSASRSARPVSVKNPAKASSDNLFKVGTPFLPEEEGFLARLEPAALGSTLVLLALISLIGYGAWSVLNEVQKVNVSPSDNTPAVLSDLDPITGRVAPVKDSQANPNLASVAESAESERMRRLYRPQALDVPVLTSRRDAPISTLDPSTVGTLPTIDQTKPLVTAQYPSANSGIVRGVDPKLGLDRPVNATLAVSTTAALPSGLVRPADQSGPQVMQAARPGVQVVAVRPSWVRIKSADGSTLYEGIMNAGESFDVPAVAEAPVMKVGESGSIYFAIDGQLYGPAGDRGSVTSKIELASTDLTERFTPVTSLGDEDLSRYVAELNKPKAQ